MQPKTEEFLNLLLWSTEKLIHPTFRNLTDSYESWAYRNGLLRQAAVLERHHFLERAPGSRGERLYRLTEKGRLHVLGGRDPEKQWSRRWDGQWRLILFDVPIEQDVQRGRLRRYLRARGFGYIQGSVWITPDTMDGEREILADGKIDVESLLLLEARPCSGETDSDIVTGAWDFQTINRCHARHLKLLNARPEGVLRDNAAHKALQRWATEERAAWRDSVKIDPFLPQRLLPSDYLGCKVWRKRIETLRLAGQQLRTYRG